MIKKNILFFYLLGFLFSLILFVFLFQINLGVKTFFYKGIFITLIVLILQFIFLLKIRSLKHFLLNKLHIYIVCLISFSFTLTLHTLVLTSIDRAISVYFIGFMKKNEKGLSKEEIKNTFYNNYFEKDDAIGRRIEEQLITGNIEEKNKKYFLTSRGKNTYKMLFLLSELFNIHNKYIEPEFNFE